MSFVRPNPNRRASKELKLTKHTDKAGGPASTSDATSYESTSATADTATATNSNNSTEEKSAYQERNGPNIFSNVMSVPFSFDTPSSTKASITAEKIKSHLFFTPSPGVDVDEEFDTPPQSYSSASFQTDHLRRAPNNEVQHVFVNFSIKSGWFSNTIQISFPEDTPPYIICAAADALRDALEDRPAGVDFTGAKLQTPTLVQTGSDWNRYHYLLEQRDILGSVDPLTIQGTILDALVNQISLQFVTSTSYGSVRNYCTTYVFTHNPALAPKLQNPEDAIPTVTSAPQAVSDEAQQPSESGIAPFQ